MLSDVHHEIGPEDISNPAIVGIIVVRNGMIGAVVDGGRVLQKAARGLKADEDIAVDDPRNYQVFLMNEKLSRRLSPGGGHLLLYGHGKLLEPCSVITLSNGVYCPLRQLFRTPPAPVEGKPALHILDQGLAILGHSLDRISRIIHGLHDVQDRYGRVQAECCAYAVVPGRVVVEDDCHLLLGIGNMPELCPVKAQAHDLVRALGKRLEPNDPRPGQRIYVRSLPGRYRDCDQHSVELRHGDSHGDVHGAAALKRLIPVSKSVVGHNGLKHRHIQPLYEPLLRSGDLLPLAGVRSFPGLDGEREHEGADQDVNYGPAVLHEEVFHHPLCSLRPPLDVLCGMKEDGNDICALPLDLLN